jgi:RNA polymerase sigma factor (sigma-70 family)
MNSEPTPSGQVVPDGRPVIPAGRTLADLDAFWDGYERTLRRYAWHLLDLRGIPDARADVDDITNDVYIDLRAAWTIVRSPIAYTRSRARVAVFNALHDEMHRGRPIGGAGDQDDDDLDVVDHDPDPEELVLDQQIDETLNAALPRALDELTPKQRAAVELTTNGDRSRQQVADELGAAPGTISSHRTRGLAKLRVVLVPLALVTDFAITGLMSRLLSRLPSWVTAVFEVLVWLWVALAALGVVVVLVEYLRDKLDRWQ